MRELLMNKLEKIRKEAIGLDFIIQTPKERTPAHQKIPQSGYLKFTRQ